MVGPAASSVERPDAATCGRGPRYARQGRRLDRRNGTARSRPAAHGQGGVRLQCPSRACRARRGQCMTDPKAAALTVVLREQPPSLDRPANILRTLLAVEQEVGYVPMEALASIANILGVTEADVVGVLSYYPDLHTTPRGRHIVRVCT